MERRDPVWRWAGTVDLHGRHGDTDFLLVFLFLIFNRQSSSISKCKNVYNCLNKTDYWGEKIWIFILWPSCDYFNKSNNNIIIIRLIYIYIYIYIYRSVALGLVLLAEFGPRKGWSQSLALRAAVKTEALVYGNMSHHNSIYCLNFLKKMERFVRYTCVLNRNTYTKIFRYEYVYHYTANMYTYIDRYTQWIFRPI